MEIPILPINIEIPAKYNELVEIIRYYYKDRDISHGFDHVEQVCKNALYIYNEIGVLTDNSELLLVITSLGHDIWDHKYIVGEECENNLKAYFMTALFIYGISSKNIMKSIKIIDSISLSKEIKQRKNREKLNLPNNIVFIRNIVSDADKLESLGKICIQRMIQYGEHNKIKTAEEHFAHIRVHSITKLYKLLDDKYIITDIGRKLAEPRMIELKSIVDNDKKLMNFIRLRKKI